MLGKVQVAGWNPSAIFGFIGYQAMVFTLFDSED